ncbi:MAG: DUF402 domain-containing protein [Candidatus Promineifilaceae bacterium]
MNIVKLDASGKEKIRYPGEPLAIDVPNGIALLARWTMREIKTEYTTFAPGDYLHEYFYTDKWYNIFALYDGSNNQLKGWYCNVTRPNILTESAVFWPDLALDVWVTPEGVATVLDEDEFAALGLDSAETQQAHQALAELLQLAQSNQLPR